MIIRLQIMYVDKKDRYNPNERIQRVGGKSQDGTLWQMTQEQVIQAIEQKQYDFYVAVIPYYLPNVVGATEAKVFVTTHSGNKYIRTESDETKEDNLLSLPDFPYLSTFLRS
jgi:hypothetical protein